MSSHMEHAAQPPEPSVPESREPDLCVSVTAGGRRGVVWWDHKLLSYTARIDVFDLADSTSPLSALRRRSTWEWLFTGEPLSAPAQPPEMVIGNDPGRFLTVDALAHELTRRQLSLDSESWAHLLLLRESVDRRWGPIILRGSHLENAPSLFYEIPYSIRGVNPPIRLEILSQSGGCFIVAPLAVVPSGFEVEPAAHRTILDVAHTIVALVWGSGGDHAEPVAWELAFEALADPLPFSLVAASVADWIAYGDGLRSGDELLAAGLVPSWRDRYRQLELNI